MAGYEPARVGVKVFETPIPQGNLRARNLDRAHQAIFLVVLALPEAVRQLVTPAATATVAGSVVAVARTIFVLVRQARAAG